MSKLRFGVLATGWIAGEFVDALQHSSDCEPVAVASRDPERAASFAAEHRLPSSYGSYDELLSDPAVEIVYVATPHPQHAEWTIKAARAGKHVLCEKPLTMNARQASEVFAVAREEGVSVFEAFAYRFHPQTERLLELVQSGAIGKVLAVDATFSYGLAPHHLTRRAIANELGGGGILDVGCYCVSAAALVAGAASGTPVAEPDQVLGAATLDPVERTDRYATAIVTYPGSILCQLACGVGLAKDDLLAVYGAEGRIVIAQPAWLPDRRTAPAQIKVVDGNGEQSLVEIPAQRHLFALEADGVARLLREGEASAAEPWWAETLANMRTLDRWRAAAGVIYPFADQTI